MIRNHQAITLDWCHPAPSSVSTAKAYGLTCVLISCRCRFMAWTIGVRQHEPRATASCRTYSAKQIGPLVTLIARHAGSAAALRPDAGQAALLTNTGFVLPPQFDRFFSRGRGNCGGN